MKALVTGATGFIGGALTRRLVEAGHEIIATGRDRDKGAALTAAGAQFEAADLTDAPRISALCAGAAVVFHVGARSSPWGRRVDFEASNVEGTRAILDGCEAHDVPRLVHVSSPSVIFAHQDVRDAKEDTPYPAKAANEYARSKRIAEELVLARRPAAAILRPRAVFGPGDAALFPRLLRVIKTGRLKIIGDGQNVVDMSYVDNVVDALVAAGERPEASGLFHITNGEPTNLWGLIAQLAARLDLPVPTKIVPYGVVAPIARTLEGFHRAFMPDKEPLITHYSASVLARSVTLNIDRARALLDYTPRVSIEEGVERFLAWWQAQEEGDA